MSHCSPATAVPHHDEHPWLHQAPAPVAPKYPHDYRHCGASYRDHYGRQHVQPADETDTQEPSTPNQTLCSFQHNKNPSRNRPDDSPDGGVSIFPRTVPHSPARATARRYQHPANSSERFANIRVRRSQQAPTLLASPPRPGHSSRMRHIFDVASLAQPLPENDAGVSYPQLPNISPTLSPTAPGSRYGQIGDRDISSNRLGLALPTLVPDSAAPNLERENQPRARTPPTRSSSSSGSWSGDSDYLVAELAQRVPTSACISQPHIDSWLSALPQEAGPIRPLSPNVCIERGSPHYRSAGRARNMTTPRGTLGEVLSASNETVGLPSMRGAGV